MWVLVESDIKIKRIKTDHQQVQLLHILKQNMYNYETYKKHIKTEHKYVQLLNI